MRSPLQAIASLAILLAMVLGWVPVHAPTATAPATLVEHTNSEGGDVVPPPALQELTEILGSLAASYDITITEDGFVPPAVTVPVGAVVTWDNATPQTHVLRSGLPEVPNLSNWIYLPLVLRAGTGGASAVAPVQSATPVSVPDGDDFSVTLAPGESFAHTFTTVGTFPYYLATSPYYQGIVVVQYDLGAPPVDPTVATDFASATAFLYTGGNPIQTGVAPGTISARRAAVLRGRVLTSDGTALPGVTITILDHPEYGQTASRADGMFDLAVNGGGVVTLDYEKAGYLPVQRKIDVPWRDYSMLPEIIMLQMDPIRTAVDLSDDQMQVVQGSTTSDVAGSRQATLLIPAGTQATLHLAYGLTETISTFHAHITEYTIGEDGQKAMPGELPPNVGYTYAVEYSVEEALAANAENVSFNQPLIHYSHNFIGFPVGFTVPQGYYDRDKGQWIASHSGRVVKVLEVTNGQASLDITGDGIPDDGSGLTPPVSPAEREKLAALYSAGQTLWRVPVTHFSPWDSNWGTTCEGNDCTPPDQPDPNDDDPPIDDPNGICGSLIECESQTLHEYTDIVGTPFTLGYSSERTLANKDAYILHIPLTGSALPRGLLAVRLHVNVAGRWSSYEFDAAPNLFVDFAWDGRDAYGRLLYGPQPVTTYVYFDYKMVYIPTDRFGYNGSAMSLLIEGNQARARFALGRKWTGVIGGFDARAFGIGGWSLDELHNYDPYRRTLRLGSGGQRRTDGIRNVVIKTFAGTGAACYGADSCGDGGPATEAKTTPDFLAVGADGSLYISDWAALRVRKVGPDGNITTVAGNGTYCVGGPCGDGGLATQAALNPKGIALDPSGNLYVVDPNTWRVRKVDTNGIITTVAGNGTPCGVGQPCGDGGPATSAQLAPQTVKISPDGSLYIGDQCNRIRKLELDGTIRTVRIVPYGLCPSTVFDIAADGTLYLLDRGLRRVSPDGDETVLVPESESSGFQFIRAITAAPDSNGVYVCDTGYSTQHNRVFFVTPEGARDVVAGNGVLSYSGDGGPSTLAGLDPRAAVLAPDGSLYIADNVNRRVRRVAPTFPGLSETEQLLIASEDGTELYVFSSSGRHLRTLDALTGVTLFQFTYDAAGYPIRIADRYGNVTSIERNADEDPTAIVAPFGQRTVLSLSYDSYLATITNPAGESEQYSYTPDGSMLTYTSPGGGLTGFTWDDRGRLTRETDAAGGQKVFTRANLSNGYKVTLTTAAGRTTEYSVEVQPDRSVRRVLTAPNGAQTVTVVSKDTSRQVTYPDGTIERVVYGPDPRWSMMSPLVSSYTLTTPGGIVYAESQQRFVQLSDPEDLLSLVSQTDTLTINGKAWTSVYDAAERTITSTTPAARVCTFTLNAKGDIIQEKVEGILPVSYTYDSHGRLSGSSQGSGGTARVVSITYNSSGFVDTITDPLHRSTSFTYDLAGRPTTLTQPGGAVIHLRFDAGGNLTGLTPPGRPEHSFAYTPVNLNNRYTPPTVSGVANPATSYVFDHDRLLTQVSRPDGLTPTLAYDGAGRLSTVTFSRGALGLSYDAVTGNLTGLASPGGLGISLGYDGILPTSVSWTGTVPGATSWGYDNDFHVTSRSVNASSPVAYTYDADDLLTQAGELSLSRSALNGLITASTLGNVSEVRSYTAFGELESGTTSYSGSPLYAEQLSRDLLGRLITRSETASGMIRVYAYRYDLDGRLTEVTVDGNPAEAYTYDSNGNRLTSTSPNAQVSATYDDQDRLLTYGNAVYTYSANGELETRTEGTRVTAFHYDELGNLTRVTLPDGTQIDYLIDGLNRRIGKEVSGVLTKGFLWQDGLRPIAELDASGNVVSLFVYATHINVPDYMVKDGATYRIITDQLGSPRLVVNAGTGVIAQRLDYDSFGNVQQDTNPGFQPFGFAGGLYDPDTGLVRFGARDYDAGTGRWLAKDSLLFKSGETNFYAYVGNDPINASDSKGFDADAPTGRIRSPFGTVYDNAKQAIKDFVYSHLCWGPVCANPEDLEVTAGTSVGLNVGETKVVQVSAECGVGIDKSPDLDKLVSVKAKLGAKASFLEKVPFLKDYISIEIGFDKTIGLSDWTKRGNPFGVREIP